MPTAYYFCLPAAKVSKKTSELSAICRHWILHKPAYRTDRFRMTAHCCHSEHHIVILSVAKNPFSLFSFWLHNGVFRWIRRIYIHQISIFKHWIASFLAMTKYCCHSEHHIVILSNAKNPFSLLSFWVHNRVFRWIRRIYIHQISISKHWIASFLAMTKYCCHSEWTTEYSFGYEESIFIVVILSKVNNP